jgi:hypothetical protein
MNRLIIIDNGFDLAHELETSYHDFILDYLKKSLKSVLIVVIGNMTLKDTEELMDYTKRN